MARLSPPLAALAFFLLAAGPARAQNLCVDAPPSDQTVSWSPGMPAPPEFTFTLSNCGDPQAQIDYSIAVLGQLANVFSVTPSNGTIPPGGGPVTVTGTIDTSADPGSYFGAVRFFDGPTVVQSWLLTVEIGDAAEFVPGDTLVGVIDGAGDTDAGRFEGLKKMVVKIKVQPDPGSTAGMLVEVVDLFGGPVKQWNVKPGKGLKKKVKLPASESYVLRFTGTQGQGGFTAKTKYKLPKIAKPRLVKNLSPKNAGEAVSAAFGGLAGGIVSANVLPVGGVPVSQISASILDPQGGAVNTSGHKSSTNVGIHFVNVPIDETGVYQVQVTGLNPGEKVKIALVPEPPAQGGDTVDVDDEGGGQN